MPGDLRFHRRLHICTQDIATLHRRGAYIVMSCSFPITQGSLKFGIIILFVFLLLRAHLLLVLLILPPLFVFLHCFSSTCPPPLNLSGHCRTPTAGQCRTSTASSISQCALQYQPGAPDLRERSCPQLRAPDLNVGPQLWAPDLNGLRSGAVPISKKIFD